MTSGAFVTLASLALALLPSAHAEELVERRKTQARQFFQEVLSRPADPRELDRTMDYLQTIGWTPAADRGLRQDQVETFFQQVLEREPSPVEVKQTLRFIAKQEILLEAKREAEKAVDEALRKKFNAMPSPELPPGFPADQIAPLGTPQAPPTVSIRFDTGPVVAPAPNAAASVSPTEFAVPGLVLPPSPASPELRAEWVSAAEREIAARVAEGSLSPAEGERLRARLPEIVDGAVNGGAPTPSPSRSSALSSVELPPEAERPAAGASVSAAVAPSSFAISAPATESGGGYLAAPANKPATVTGLPIAPAAGPGTLSLSPNDKAAMAGAFGELERALAKKAPLPEASLLDTGGSGFSGNAPTSAPPASDSASVVGPVALSADRGKISLAIDRILSAVRTPSGTQPNGGPSRGGKPEPRNLASAGASALVTPRLSLRPLSFSLVRAGAGSAEAEIFSVSAAWAFPLALVALLARLGVLWRRRSRLMKPAVVRPSPRSRRHVRNA